MAWKRVLLLLELCHGNPTITSDFSTQRKVWCFLCCLHRKNNAIYSRVSVDMMTSWNGNIFLRYWPFMWGIHRSPVNFPHKVQWCGALMVSLICAPINAWVNNLGAGDLRRHRARYSVVVMIWNVMMLILRYCTVTVLSFALFIETFSSCLHELMYQPFKKV